MTTNHRRAIESFSSTHLLAFIIFFSAFLIFILSPIHPINDSKYSMLLGQSLIDHRSFVLDRYAIPRLPPLHRDDYVQNGDIYQIEQVGPHLYYFFPPGNSILSVPFVLLANAAGVSAVNSDQTFNPRGEQVIEKWIAAFLMSILSIVFFYIGVTVLPTRHSLLITVAAILGTQVWSTTSRAMFSDTWPLLLLSISLLLIFRSETRGEKGRPIVIATLMVAAYVTYPLYIVHFAAIAFYFLLTRRRSFVLFCATAAGWLLLFGIYSWVHFKQLLPNYFQASRLNFSVLMTALPGHLISPSRGLLVFVPTTAIVFYLLVRYWSTLKHRKLLLIAFVALFTHLLVVSAFAHWWGGHSYGPRLLTAWIPWLVLLTVLGVEAMRDASRVSRNEKRTFATALVFLLLVAVFIHARGAISPSTMGWNSLPSEVDQHPERLWDWRYPQFLAGLIRPEPPAVYPIVEIDKPINFTQPDGEKYLWYGWSGAEPDGRWSDSTEATMVFEVSEVRTLRFDLTMAAFVVPGKIEQQNLFIKLNGQQVAASTLSHGSMEVYSFNLPNTAMTKRNIITFVLPNAASPLSFGVGSDERQLGIKIMRGQFSLP